MFVNSKFTAPPIGPMSPLIPCGPCGPSAPSTPPNAVVFGSGYLKIKDMIRTGLLMNFISIIIVSLYICFVLPEIWDLESIVLIESLN